ncbi:MAG: transposase [Planctomycetaceae bacterium]|nr:transposase [Planctomycetales bacterium]MCB9938754.1 transposase [Planctomycetaceae bacterium]
MPRRPRFATGNYLYHVLNRAVGRATIFEKESDYAAFLRVVEDTREQVPVRLLSFCLMPNHWHLILWPKENGDLSEYMRLLTVTHTARWHKAHGTAGTGPIYQGRFKSFPIQSDDHFYTVARYVERNALTGKLVRRAENWRWSSLWIRENDTADVTLAKWPLARPSDWNELVNQPQTAKEIESVQHAIKRGCPFGSETWAIRTAERLGLESTLRPRGRPRSSR